MLPRSHVSWQGTLPEVNVARLNRIITTAMRFARAISAYDCRDPHLDRLVESADLDVLQLDYQWPNSTVADQRPWKSYASGFLDQLQRLHNSLYLDPQLHLVTNAGGGNTLECMDAVADFLCQHDSGELPISAIRGDHVLASLEEFMAQGIELRDPSTGTSVLELTQPVLAAHLELGAGPLKTAFDEGTRMAIAGCYDIASPILAAAMGTSPLTWDCTDVLAQLAQAARWHNVVVAYDYGDDLQLVKQRGFASGNSAALQRIQESAAADGRVDHADVSYRASDWDGEQAGEAATHPGQMQGQVPSGDWKLNVTYSAGYFAEAAWELESDGERPPARTLLETMRSDLGYPQEDPSLEIDLLRRFEDGLLEDAPDRATALVIRLRYRHRQRRKCEEFVSAVKNFRARHLPRQCAHHARLSAVQLATARLCCPVPREVVTVSVDTRPAKEWR